MPTFTCDNEMDISVDDFYTDMSRGEREEMAMLLIDGGFALARGSKPDAPEERALEELKGSLNIHPLMKSWVLDKLREIQAVIERKVPMPNAS